MYALNSSDDEDETSKGHRRLMVMEVCNQQLAKIGPGKFAGCYRG